MPGLGDKLYRILTGAVEVDRAIFFSVIITIAAFLPLFTMQGVEGQIFGPMSRTYAYALAGAVIATFTVTPVAAILLPSRVDEVETFCAAHSRDLRRHPAARGSPLYGAAAIALTFLVVRRARRAAGTEFLPKLEEGNMWVKRAVAADGDA
jgi:cobalt-zinc-cadmium resistance protein CzcA